MGVMVGSFGIKKGVEQFTITGTKEDLYRILDEIREAGGKFDDTPIINPVFRGQWVLKLKLKIPVGVVAHDNKT